MATDIEMVEGNKTYFCRRTMETALLVKPENKT